MAMRSCYLYNRNSYAGKKVAFYGNEPGHSDILFFHLARGFDYSQVCSFLCLYTSDIDNYVLTLFLHELPWILPWIKLISNELDITIHMIASQLSHYCDVIGNWLWRHQQNEDRVSEAPWQYVRIFIFVVIYGLNISCKK